MSTFKNLDNLEIIGGYTCPRSPAPFGRGPVVVRFKDCPSLILIAFKITGDEATGDQLTPEEWANLVESFQAMELKTPIPAHSYAAAWVFTSVFEGRDQSIESLRKGEGVLSQEGDLVIVDEWELLGLRPKWRDLARTETLERIKAGDLEGAQRSAERMISLAPLFNKNDVSLLADVYDLRGKHERASALRLVVPSKF